MSDEEALIAGIREHPLDDLRRLVYADWLDERGRANEAEYLRLVAALAQSCSPLHAEHLGQPANLVDWYWRSDVGRRFDVLSDDEQESPNLVVTYEAAINIAAGLTGTGSSSKYVIVPSTESSVRNLPLQDIVLEWVAKIDVESLRAITSLDSTLSALGHLRRILLTTSETTRLATAVPQTVTEAMRRFAVNLQCDVSDLDANYRVRAWRDVLSLSTDLDGELSDPPFSGWIGVEARSRSEAQSV